MIELLAFEGRWVYIGEVEEKDGWFYIKNGVNIRYWGTSRGLGELVKGPTKNTKLDPIGTIRVPVSKLTAGGAMIVDQEIWKKVLDEVER